jgi:hypothetical protein
MAGCSPFLGLVQKNFFSINASKRMLIAFSQKNTGAIYIYNKQVTGVTREIFTTQSNNCYGMLTEFYIFAHYQSLQCNIRISVM